MGHLGAVVEGHLDVVGRPLCRPFPLRLRLYAVVLAADDVAGRNRAPADPGESRRSASARRHWPYLGHRPLCGLGCGLLMCELLDDLAVDICTPAGRRR